MEQMNSQTHGGISQLHAVLRHNIPKRLDSNPRYLAISIL